METFSSSTMFERTVFGYEKENRADYDVDIILSENAVEELIQRAKEFLANAQAYLT